MRHLDLVAAIEGLRDALLVVDAQYLAEIGRAVAEDGEVFAHALLQQAEDEGLGQGRLDQLRQSARLERLREAAGSADGARSLAYRGSVM